MTLPEMAEFFFILLGCFMKLRTDQLFINDCTTANEEEVKKIFDDMFQRRL